MGLGMSFAGCECDDTAPRLGRLTAEADIMPSTVEFGEVPLGASIEKEVTVKNTGTDTLKVCLQVSQLAGIGQCVEGSMIEPVGGPFATLFEAMDDEGNWPVAVGETRTFAVRFTPLVAGEVTGQIRLVHTGFSKEHTIVLHGIGVAPNVMFSHTQLDFGDVAVGKRKQIDISISNGTNFAQPMTISPVAQDAIVFGTAYNEVDNPTDAPWQNAIPPNGSLTITVWFEPADEVAYMNTLNVQFCPDCYQAIGLTGTGVKPAFEVDPAILDFGQLDEGAMATESFVVRNIGNSPLTVETIELAQGTSTEFATAPQATLPHTLGPSEELVVAVTYTGVTPGRDDGRVIVTTDAWDDPGTTDSESIGYVELLAISTGPDIQAFPPAVNFQTVQINGSPATRMLLLENVGNADLIIETIALQTMTAEYTLTMAPSLPVTVAPSSSVEVQVTYAPIDAGIDQAVILVGSNDRDEASLPVPVQGIGGVPSTCAVTIAPTQLAFGLVERGRDVTLPVEIRNGGAQPCTISNIRLNGDTEFTLANTMAMVTVAPGSSHPVEITYSPAAYGTHSSNLEFDTDDPGSPMRSVPVSGVSAQSDVRVIPSELNFNVVPVTCRSPRRAITIYNTGNNAVTITEVSLDPTTTTEFELQNFNTPASLGAGGSTVIELRYHPRDIGPDTGVLFIVIDLGAGQIQRVAVPLLGEGQVNPTVTDTFQQVPTPQADVLFVVDDSCSMQEEQSNLGSNLGAFLAYATQEGIDFQIAVTTTDIERGGAHGRFVPVSGGSANRIIRPNTPNATSAFQSNVSQGTNGSVDEQGLEAAYLALSDPLINTHNAGFLRTDAALAVIIVSDEEDHSSRALSFYENFLRNIKGFQNSGMFSLSAIVGTRQPTCQGAGGRAEYADRYIRVSQNTGGVVESICNANWGQTLANIGLNSFGLKRQFILSSTPVPTTIAVTVDTIPVPAVTPGGQTRWTYDQPTNSVTFQPGSVPQANATIEVTYTVACLP